MRNARFNERRESAHRHDLDYFVRQIVAGRHCGSSEIRFLQFRFQNNQEFAEIDKVTVLLHCGLTWNTLRAEYSPNPIVFI